MATVKKMWQGIEPKTCDIPACGNLITTEFVDGATRMGPWANMCPSCHMKYGRGCGTGQGQRYRKDKDGHFVKIEG